jgi:hypothetical protein
VTGGRVAYGAAACAGLVSARMPGRTGPTAAAVLPPFSLSMLAHRWQQKAARRGGSQHGGTQAFSRSATAATARASAAPKAERGGCRKWPSPRWNEERSE